MLGVASTLALMGLISLVIPILIHLFNPGKGRLVWTGNINLVRLANKKAVTERRITDWLLLLLRLFIFILITLLLAKTYYNGKWDSADKKLVLVSPQWIAQASDEQVKTVMASGDEVISLTGELSHWTSLAWHDQQRPANETFEVYTTNQLAGFDHAIKPQLEHEVNWHIISATAQSIDPIEKSVAIYGEQDNRQLKAALNALKTHRLSGLTLQFFDSDSDFSQSADWIIWSSQLPVPDELKAMAAKGSIVIHFVGKKAITRKLWGDGLLVELPTALQEKPDFANSLIDAMTTLTPAKVRFAQATLSGQQIQTHKRPSKVDKQDQTPLHNGLILLLVFCWIAERALAEKSKSVEAAK